MASLKYQKQINDDSSAQQQRPVLTANRVVVLLALTTFVTLGLVVGVRR